MRCPDLPEISIPFFDVGELDLTNFPVVGHDHLMGPLVKRPWACFFAQQHLVFYWFRCALVTGFVGGEGGAFFTITFGFIGAAFF